jgi:hypothetical protein
LADYKFKVAMKFGGLRDVVPFPCPFGSGAVFHIRRAGSKFLKEKGIERLKASPLSCAAFAEMMTADPSELASVEGEGSRAFELGLMQRAAKKVIESGQASPVDLMLGHGESDIESATDLVERWDNVTDDEGQRIGFSADALHELATSPVPVPEGYPYAGMTVGEAHRAFFRESSTRTEAFRIGIVEAAVKNLPASTAGDDSGGDATTSEAG